MRQGARNTGLVLLLAGPAVVRVVCHDLIAECMAPGKASTAGGR